MNCPVMTLGQAVRSAEVFIDGDWVESKDQDPQGDVRLVQLADVGDGEYLDKSARFLTSAKARELKCTYLKPGDVMIARMPDPLGRACIFPGDQRPSVTVVDVCIVRPGADGPDPRWLMHCLNSRGIRNQIAAFATGTTRSRISRGNLAKIKIPVPPLPEQRRIAEILDKADALRAKRRAALAQLDTLTQSIFLDMFGDPATNPKGFPIAHMGDVCDVRDGTHDSPKYISGGGYPLVTSKNVTGGIVDLTDVNYISEADYVQINKRSKVDRGDIILPMIGTIGSPVLVDHEPRYAIKNVALIKFTKTSPSAVFVRQLLNGEYFDHIVSQKNRGGTQKFVSLGDLRAFPLPLPSKDEQREFARRIEAVEKARTVSKASETELNALFASLQQSAFRGEL